MKNLSGKRVLITGGTRGIGAATAKRYLEEGSRVAVLGRDQVALEEIKKELPQLEATFIADVAITEMDITLEEWQKIMNINLTGLFYVAQQAARRMLAAEQKGDPKH